MGKELFSLYVWLLETIHRAGKITFEEINARWLRSELSGGETLSLRTCLLYTSDIFFLMKTITNRRRE